MGSYVRPMIEAPVFHDADGAVIDYGNRWQGSPPQDAYSVDSHPERFAPIHVVADALIAYLGESFDVEIDEGVEVTGDLLHPVVRDVVRAVRIRPRDPKCASLTFVLTAYPGIHVHAGLLHDFHYPICGCDACDSTWQAEAHRLERRVLAIVSGNFRETIDPATHPRIEYALTYPDGAESGETDSSELPSHRVDEARSVLQDLEHGWNSWITRAAASAP